MKPYYISIIIILVLGCSQNSGTDRIDNTSEKKIKKQVTAVAEKYIMSQLTDAKRTATKDGTITFSNDQKKYVFEPSKIFNGLIDDDQKEDALVTLSTYDEQFQTVSEQLVILKVDDEFTLAGAIESDMRIISLKDRIITADVPEHSRNNPLFNCQSCWEVVKFQYRMGEFVKIE
jgi:DNA integrity scanning protein DisA with diadenylate cyclase activity